MKKNSVKKWCAFVATLALFSACNSVKVAQTTDINGVRETATTRTSLSADEQIFDIALKRLVDTAAGDTLYSLTIFHPYSYKYDIAAGDSLSLIYPDGAWTDIVCDSVSEAGKEVSTMGTFLGVGGLGVGLPIPLGKGKKLHAWHYSIPSGMMNRLLTSDIRSVNYCRAKGYKRRVISDNKLVRTIDRCLRTMDK